MNDPKVQGSPAGLSTGEATALVVRMRESIRAAVIGQDAVIDEILVGLLGAGHVLIEGVPGLGKTLLARALAKTFAGRFTRIQFTPDLMPTDITGHVIYDLKREEFKLHRGPIFTHLLLADEINRAPAKTQSALLEVMQERQVSIEGRPLAVPSPFMTIATQNPIEQEGTYPLPEAQVDRFLLKVLIDYPDLAREEALVHTVTHQVVGDVLDVSAVDTVINAEEVLALQRCAAEVQIDGEVSSYGVRIVRATRDWPGVQFGAGPRGGLSLVRASRAYALMQGRVFVTPDDVKAMAPAVLRHRIILDPEVELEGQAVDDLLADLLSRIEAPRR